MIGVRRLARPAARVRFYATGSSPNALLFIEHRGGAIESGTRSALTAAAQLGGSVTGIVIGAPGEVEPIVEQARKWVLWLPSRVVSDQCAD